MPDRKDTHDIHVLCPEGEDFGESGTNFTHIFGEQGYVKGEIYIGRE